MKKVIALLVSVMLCLSLTLPALAITSEYASTQAVMDALDGANYTFTYRGMNDSGYEIIRMNFGTNKYSLTMNLFCDKTQTETSIRVWNIITYDPSKETEVMVLCNKLNSDYKYVKFYADTTDNTVTCDMDVLYRKNDVGPIVLEAITHVADIIEDCYSQLAAYDK